MLTEEQLKKIRDKWSNSCSNKNGFWVFTEDELMDLLREVSEETKNEIVR